MCGRRRIHLDEVRGLGQFLEIEVVLDSSETTADGERVVHELMAALEIPQSTLVAGAHIDLLQPAGCYPEARGLRP